MWRTCTKSGWMLVLLATAACSGLPQRVDDSQPVEQSVTAVAERDYAEVLALVDAEDYASATPKLERFIAKHSEYPGAYTTLAILYAEQGRAADANQAINIALSIDAEFAPALNQRGVLQRREGDFRGAEQSWKAALMADPEYAYAWHNLGVLYDLYLADLPAALAYYERYQVLAADESSQTERWMADLRRRIDTQPRAARAEEVAP